MVAVVAVAPATSRTAAPSRTWPSCNIESPISPNATAESRIPNPNNTCTLSKREMKISPTLRACRQFYACQAPGVVRGSYPDDVTVQDPDAFCCRPLTIPSAAQIVDTSCPCSSADHQLSPAQRSSISDEASTTAWPLAEDATGVKAELPRVQPEVLGLEARHRHCRAAVVKREVEHLDPGVVAIDDSRSWYRQFLPVMPVPTGITRSYRYMCRNNG